MLETCQVWHCSLLAVPGSAAWAMAALAPSRGGGNRGGSWPCRASVRPKPRGELFPPLPSPACHYRWL